MTTSNVPPTITEIDNYIQYNALQDLSGNFYIQYVQDEANKSHQWALDMIRDVNKVTEYVSRWSDYIDLIALRHNGGISGVCGILPHALPITKSASRVSIQKCIITGQTNRPCFAITSVKLTGEIVYVHHSLMSACQTIWTMLHITNVIEHSVRVFRATNIDTSLGEICKSFQKSKELDTICKYIHHVCHDMNRIGTRDNIFVV
jgi:hypothetical protein